MAQKKFNDNITREWKAFDEIVDNFDSSVKYQVQNQGFDLLVAMEVADKPSEDQKGGDIVLPYKVWTYEPEEGKTLYFRAFNQSCSINITTKGE